MWQPPPPQPPPGFPGGPPGGVTPQLSPFWQQQQQQQQQRVAQLDAAALGIARGLATSGRYAAFGAVLSGLLAQVGAPEWAALGLGPSPQVLSCLAHLFRVEQQVRGPAETTASRHVIV